MTPLEHAYWQGHIDRLDDQMAELRASGPMTDDTGDTIVIAGAVGDLARARRGLAGLLPVNGEQIAARPPIDELLAVALAQLQEASDEMLRRLEAAQAADDGCDCTRWGSAVLHPVAGCGLHRVGRRDGAGRGDGMSTTRLANWQELHCAADELHRIGNEMARAAGNLKGAGR